MVRYLYVDMFFQKKKKKKVSVKMLMNWPGEKYVMRSHFIIHRGDRRVKKKFKVAISLYYARGPGTGD